MLREEKAITTGFRKVLLKQTKDHLEIVKRHVAEGEKDYRRKVMWRAVAFFSLLLLAGATILK